MASENKIDNQAVEENASNGTSERKNYCFFRRFLKDFLTIFALCYLYFFLESLIIFGYKGKGNLILPIFSGLFYGVVCYFIFLFTIRFFKSKLSFFLLASLVATINFHHGISSAGKGYTLKLLGHYMYKDGDISLAGYLYQFLNPLSFLAIYALILTIINLHKKFKSK